MNLGGSNNYYLFNHFFERKSLTTGQILTSLKDTDYTVSHGKTLKDGADEFVLTDSKGNFSGVVDMFIDKVLLLFLT